MYNINGELSDNHNSCLNNRAFLYGDAVFETCKISNGKVLFLEDHYFRLMASMRILRMEIPLEFTLEYLESEIFKTINALNFNKILQEPVRRSHCKAAGLLVKFKRKCSGQKLH